MNISKIVGAIAGAVSAFAAFAGAEWSGSDLLLRGENGVVYRHELTSGDSINASMIYISTNDCGAALVANGATITASGTVYLGYQYKTNLASHVALALTNTTMSVSGAISVYSVPTSGSATMTLGPGSMLSAKYFSANCGCNPSIYFNGGQLKTTSSYVFNPSGHSWKKNASGGWADAWDNPSAYVYANEGPIDISVDKDARLVQGNGGRAVYLQGTKGFVKRGTGVLDWVWYPSANNGSVGGNVTYTGDTVVKGGGIRVGDTWTYTSGVDTRPLRNPMPARSPLILEANTFLDVSSNASTWCSISGAGIVTNRTTQMRGKVILGGTVADCELSPASVGGKVDVYKIGSGTLTVDTASVDGEIVVSNGTLKIASGSTLAAKKVVLRPNTTLNTSGATLTADVVKTGSGANTFVGATAIDGTFTVAEGTVRCVPRGFSGKFFRMTISKNNWDPKYTQFAEFYLYDENGQIIDDGRPYTRAAEGCDPSTLAEKQASELKHHTDYAFEKVEMAFDGLIYYPGSSNCSKFNDVYIPTAADPIVICFRMTANTPRVFGYNFVAANDGNGARNPVTWKFEGSYDGVTWYTLDEKVNATTPSENSTTSKTVFFNGGVPYDITGAGDPSSDDVYPFGENATIAVASGATLDFDSVNMKIAALAFDASLGYGGKITRFTPSEQGVLSVTTDGNIESLIDTTVVLADEVAQSRNLRNWKVRVNGVFRDDLILKLIGNAVKLEWRPGLILVVR